MQPIMNEEFYEVLEAAMLQEVASNALYTQSQRKTKDPAVAALLKEFAADEKKHLEILRQLKEHPIHDTEKHQNHISDLRLNEYLVSAGSLEDANLQDTLTFAITEEQKSIDFYSRLMSVYKSVSAKALCQDLVTEEMKHKQKLELLYDKMFYSEN